MKAAELLRGLDKAATAGRWVAMSDRVGFWWVDAHTGNDAESVADVPERKPLAEGIASCIATTRNLLPLLAGLVEALGDFMDPEKDDNVDANYQRVERAYAALNAAAAKEV